MRSTIVLIWTRMTQVVSCRKAISPAGILSTMTSITTSIHLPDGTLARTDGSSAVIYKIVKMNNAPLSILNDFVKPGKK